MTRTARAAAPVGSEEWVARLLAETAGARAGSPRARLGVRLATRLDNCLALIEARDRRTSDLELQRVRRLHRRAAVLAIARWLIDARNLDGEELEWFGGLGRTAARHGAGLAPSIDGYYLWRDATIEVLRDEALREGLAASELEPALEMVRRSCDSTLRRMANAFDAQRVEQAEELTESQRRLRTLFVAMPCGGCLVSPDGRILLANQAAAELLDMPLEELQGARVDDLAPRLLGPDGAPVQVPFAEIELEPGRPYVETQLEAVARDGRRTCLKVHAVPLHLPDGQLEALLTVFMDVTSVQEAAEARRESEAKSRFLAAMSHELRTPLNSVLGFAQLLKMEAVGPLNARQLRHVDNVLASGSSLLELVNDILDIAKARAGELSVDVEPVAIDRVVEEVRRSLAHLASEKRVRLTARSDRGLVAMADAKRLEQVLSNLVMNAIKFTERGSIALVARGEPEGALITVSDTGVGIPADELRRVFEEFVQLDAGRARRYEGSGLGLPLSNRLVHLMGGTLRLESRVGEGTLAEVRLPRR